MRQIPILNPVIKDLNPFQEMLAKCKKALIVVFIFSFCSNMLMLITPLYSLQVLDRVIGSGNTNTLLMLSIIIGSVYLIYGLVQVARSFTLIKIGEWLDTHISPMLLSHSVSAAATRQSLSASQILRDFQSVKTFLTSIGINTLFDAPWTIAYLIAIFMIHPYIGYITIVGGVVIVSFAFFNAIATSKILGESTEYSIKGMNQAEIAARNAEVVEAMGMMKNISKNWKKYNDGALSKQSIASYRNGTISNISRYIRNLIQMSVTATGAYVVITTHNQDMTTGAMIASSILVGRALAPFDNFIEVWKQINSTMKSYARINETFKYSSLRDQAMPINDVKGNLAVDNVYYAHAVQNAPKSNNPLQMMMAQQQQPKHILKGVSFALDAGEVLAIIGPSAAGKSTLAKVLVGVWKPSSGNVRLDSGDVYQWNRENFGKHVGYLPQGIELFSGTIKDNIARMCENADPDRVIEAAKMAGAHELFLKFPNGYDTDIGVAGSNLSGGQRQRVGLARAFYGNPKFVVLDEPNANLDESGEKALAQALIRAKDKGITCIVISHRPSILSVVDKVLILQDGLVGAYGPTDEVLNRIRMVEGSMEYRNKN